MASTQSYILFVHVDKAKNLPKMDLIGKIDAYVKLTCKAIENEKPTEKSEESPIVKCEYNPVWDYTIVCDKVLLDQYPITLSVYDWDKNTSDDFLWDTTITKQILPQFRNEVQVAEKGHENKKEPSLLWYSAGIFPSFAHLKDRVRTFVDEDTTATFSDYSVSSVKTSLGLEHYVYISFLKGKAGMLVHYQLHQNEKVNKNQPYYLPVITLLGSGGWIFRFGRGEAQNVVTHSQPQKITGVSEGFTHITQLCNTSNFLYQVLDIAENIELQEYVEVFGITLQQVLSSGESVGDKTRFKTGYGLIKVKNTPPHKPKFTVIVTPDHICDIVRPGATSLARTIVPANLGAHTDTPTTLKVRLADASKMDTDFRFVVYKKVAQVALNVPALLSLE